MNFTPNQMSAGRRGDFDGVASRYSPVLFRVALRGLRNVEDAEDAVQDALLSAYKHIGQFEGRSQFSPWLTRIVINTAGMKLRKPFVPGNGFAGPNRRGDREGGRGYTGRRRAEPGDGVRASGDG